MGLDPGWDALMSVIWGGCFFSREPKEKPKEEMAATRTRRGDDISLLDSAWCRGMRDGHWHLYGHERCVSCGGKGKRPPPRVHLHPEPHPAR